MYICICHEISNYILLELWVATHESLSHVFGTEGNRSRRRKPTHTGRTCKLHTGPLGIKPWIFLLWGDSTNHCKMYFFDILTWRWEEIWSVLEPAPSGHWMNCNKTQTKLISVWTQKWVPGKFHLKLQRGLSDVLVFSSLLLLLWPFQSYDWMWASQVKSLNVSC